ncbi:MAG: hypothetical protein ACLGQX_01020 [Acidobacteriota bacterium]
MKLRFLVPVLALALTTIAAHAQYGLYVNPVVTRFSINPPDTGDMAFLGQGQSSQVFGGIMFGGYDEFLHRDKVDIGVDIRDAWQHGNNATINSFLGGFIVEAKPMKLFKLKPYGEFMVGDGRTTSALNIAHINRVQFGIYGGLDRPLTPHVDWRIAEVSWGEVQAINSQTFVFNGTAVPNTKMLGFSTGFVFRFK